MTKLKFFDSGLGLVAVRLGLISPSYLQKYDMYKTYLSFCEKLSNLPKEQAKAKAKQMTMDQYNADYYVVWRAVNCFEDGLQISVNNSVH